MVSNGLITNDICFALDAFGRHFIRPRDHQRDDKAQYNEQHEHVHHPIGCFGVVQNQIYNVGSDDMNYTIGQVGEMIERLVPTAALKNMGSDVDRRNYRVAFAKIRRHIGFEPDWSLERGIFQVIDALKNHRVTDYHDPRYSNVRFLRDEGASSLLTAPDRGPAWDLTQQSSSGR